MKNIEFGMLLEKLLYLSNQKKSTLAKELGYDISYISKWINGKNLPSQKTISDICEITSQFIVKSLSSISKEQLKKYFEIDVEDEDDTSLVSYIGGILKESYMYTAKQTSSSIYKSTKSEEEYNSIMHINPNLRKTFLTKDATLYINESNKIDLILSTNLYKLQGDDKVAIAEMKSSLAQIQNKCDIRVRVLIGFEGSKTDTILNTLIIIKMITTFPNLNVEVYNCNIENSNILAVIKDRIFHSAIYASNGRCLFTNMSKEKAIVDEVYYSLDEILRTQGKLLVEKKSSLDILRDKTYIQYIMGQNLKLMLGSMNEFFMPTDLFMEVAQDVFGKDEVLLNELRKINTFLQNVTYKSNIKVLIYEPELIKYISTGEITFFNVPVKLKLEQMERHIKNIEKIIKTCDGIEIKLIEGNFIEDIDSDLNPSIYLSKSLKLIKTNPIDNVNDYAIIKDLEFKKICDEVFEKSWSEREEILVSEKSDILDRISKTLIYARIMSDEMN